jgi:hypothetical protein
MFIFNDRRKILLGHKKKKQPCTVNVWEKICQTGINRINSGMILNDCK